MTDTHITEVVFSDLKLAEPLLQGIESAGFSHCTPIQAQTLPITLEGNDILGQAQTGTGKTAAFLLAILHRLQTVPPSPNRKKNQPRASDPCGPANGCRHCPTKPADAVPRQR